MIASAHRLLLVTKPHVSAYRLSKPFKTPLRTPLIDKATIPLPSGKAPAYEEAAKASRGILQKVDADRQVACNEGMEVFIGTNLSI